MRGETRQEVSGKASTCTVRQTSGGVPVKKIERCIHDYPRRPSDSDTVAMEFMQKGKDTDGASMISDKNRTHA